MRAKSLVLILIALGCGLVASIGISQVMESNSNRGPGVSVATQQIYVSLSDCDINTKMTAENVKLEEWPADKVPEGAITKLEDLDGQYTRQRLYAGEPILFVKLTDSTTQKTGYIPAGYRVTTIQVQVDQINGGLIGPGDRVDIVAFLRPQGEILQPMTKTILRNVRIFAVNDDIERSEDSDGRSIQVRHISLLVKEEQIEPLMLATELGRLKMSLRRPDDETEVAGTGEATVSDIMRGMEEVADQSGQTEEVASGSGNTFLDFLNKATEQSDNAEAVQPVGFEMTILSPEGATQYHWTDEESLPDELREGGLSSSSSDEEDVESFFEDGEDNEDEEEDEESSDDE